MKKITLIVLALLLVAGAAYAQTVVGSRHDLSATGASTTFRSNNVNRVCVFCHTPHQPDSPTFIDTDPLWNHTLSSVAGYNVYASDTLNATPTNLGGGTTVSNLCLSCHDGTVGLGNLYNDPNEAGTPSNSGLVISGNALLGTDLSNDHPVNFTFDAGLSSADGELNDPTTAAVGDLLFGGTVQCASCHDPHDSTNTPFLVMDNTNSALCTTCHIK